MKRVCVREDFQTCINGRNVNHYELAEALGIDWAFFQFCKPPSFNEDRALSTETESVND